MTSTFGTGGARFHVGGDPGPVDTVYLGVFRRSAGDAAGWFDESLIRNQDYELNIRLRAAGGVVWFDPELAVTYRPRPSIGALARQYFEYGEWKAVVIRRYPDSAKLRQVVPAAATALLAMSVVIVPWRRRAAIVPLTYVAAVVMEATRLARDRRVGLLHLVRIFPAMQLGWGFGFLVGLRRWFTRSVGGPAASAATPSAT